MRSKILPCSLLLWLAVVMTPSSGFAMPPNVHGEEDQWKELLENGWVQVAPGVLQRKKGGHKVETLATGAAGFSWILGQLQADLGFLLDEDRLRPTAELGEAIRDLEMEIWKIEGYIQDLQIRKSAAMTAETGCTFSYSAQADAHPETSFQGVGANADASFSDDCGDSGETFAYALARATLNGTTTTVTQTDPRSGPTISSHAVASVAGTADCYSYATARAMSSPRELFYSVADENFECTEPGQSYFAVPPCRILDTRNTTILTNAQPRVVNIAGLCGIPSTAKAVSFNVTAVSPTGSGKFRLYPGDLTVSLPAAFISSLTFAPATSPRANSAVIRLATNGTGTLGIYPEVSGSPGQVHLVLDVQGYFSTDTSPAPGAQGPLGFQTLAPCRMAWPSSPLVAGTVTTFTAQGVCGVPVGAAVASLNVGVAHPAYSGHITLYPSNIATPGVSTLNFNSGISILRNSALVNLSPTTPDLAAYFGSTAGASVYVHFDVNGYFKSDAPLKYHPITPCRAVGGALLTTDTVSTFQIQGNCGVPVGAKAALLRLQVARPTSSGDLTVYPSNLPLSEVMVSTVKFDANEPELSMGAIVPLSTLVNDLAASPGEMTAGGTLALSIDVFGYFQ